MACRTRTLNRQCTSCGQQGTMTYLEEDVSSEDLRWVAATGPFRLSDQGRPVCECGTRAR